MEFTKFILLMSLLLFTCCKNKTSTFVHNKMNNVDTVVVSKKIPKEIVGSLFRETEYFVVTGKDTSYFSCIFIENKENGKINIKFEYDQYTKKYLASLLDTVAVSDVDLGHKALYYKTTYRQQIGEFKMILKKSAENFDFNKLQYLHFGLLVSSGDLAVNITNQCIKEFGTNITNQDVKQILLDSQLGIDLNSSLNPYSITVEYISIEKLHFVTKNELYKISTMGTDSVQIPDSILNCFVYVKLKKF